MTDANNFELLESDPKRSPAKTKKQKGVSRMTSRNIDDMSTTKILWHVVKRHRVGILGTALILSWVFFIVKSLPSMAGYLTR